MTTLQVVNLEPDELRALIREELRSALSAQGDTRPLLSTAQVAERLGFKSAAVARGLIESGALHGIRIGDAWRVTETALARFCQGDTDQLSPASASCANPGPGELSSPTRKAA